MTDANKPDPKAVYHRFCHTLGSAKYVFKDGTVATFIKGEFFTTDKAQIAELQVEADNKRNPHIHVEAAKKTVVAEDRDPMVALKKKLRAEILKEEGLVPTSEDSASEPTKVVPQVTGTNENSSAAKVVSKTTAAPKDVKPV